MPSSGRVNSSRRAALCACRPDLARFGDGELGLVVAYACGRPGGAEAEVRVFVQSLGVGEDPVIGSLNAGLAQWLAGLRQPASYVASRGPCSDAPAGCTSTWRTTRSRWGRGAHDRAGASPSGLFALRGQSPSAFALLSQG